MDALFALFGAMDDGLAPELGGERQIDRFVQPIAAGSFLRQDQLDRVDQRAVLRGRGQVQPTHHPQDGGAVTFVEQPQQRQVIVATMRRNGVAVGLQRLHATMGVDQAADFTPRLGVAAMMVEDADHIRHRRHDRFGLLAIARPQPLQFLSAPVVDVPHALDEHLREIVARLDPGPVDQAHQYGVALGGPKLAQLRSIQCPCLGGEVLALDLRDARQVQLAADQFTQFGDMVDQLLEMLQRRALG